MSTIFPVSDGSPALGYFGYSLTLNNGDDIDGTTVSVRFTWIDRTRGWYFDLYGADGAAILQGERMNPGAVWKFPGEVPPGALSCFGADEYIQSDLGTNLLLVYFTPTEVASIEPDPFRMTLGP
jgi:hypothetical protein